MTQASTETSVQTEIDDVANQYFDLVYTNDLAILDRIFDDNAHLYGKNEAGEVLLWPIARYRAVLANRQSRRSLARLASRKSWPETLRLRRRRSSRSGSGSIRSFSWTF
jgi:Putative lumazine-binding